MQFPLRVVVSMHVTTHLPHALAVSSICHGCRSCAHESKPSHVPPLLSASRGLSSVLLLNRRAASSFW